MEGNLQVITCSFAGNRLVLCSRAHDISLQDKFAPHNSIHPLPSWSDLDAPRQEQQMPAQVGQPTGTLHAVLLTIDIVHT